MSKRTSKSAGSRIGNYHSAPEQSLFDTSGPSSSKIPLAVPARFQPMMSGQGGAKRTQEEAELEGDEDEDEEEEGGKGKNANKRNATSTGRRKITIQYIDDKSKRHVSFTKRKSGLMKKAFELSTLTGTQCLVVVVSETGAVYSFGTPGLRPIVEVEQGKALIQASLRGELSPTTAVDNALMDDDNAEIYASFDYDFPPSDGLSIYPPNSLLPVLPALPALPTLPAFTLPTSSSPYIPILSQTPYERAQAEHVQAFATYQARYSQHSTSTSISANAFASTSDLSALGGGNAASRAVSSRAAVYGAHSFTEAARSWNPPADEHGNGWTDGRRAGSIASGEGGGLGAAGEFGQMEERRRLLKEEAARAVSEAKQKRSIPSFLEAHTLASRPQLAIPPPHLDSSLPRHGIELTMQQFGAYCEANGYTQPHQLQLATQAFVDKWLPSQNLSCRSMDEARQHLTLFFDFLEGHALITSTEHALLTSFPALLTSFPALASSHSASTSASNSFSANATASASPIAEGDERGGVVTKLWEEWVKTVNEKYAGEMQDASVEGWFEIYRVRGNFVVLKEKELHGDSSINSLLAPFKLRIPRDLSSQLKIDDAVCLSIRRVATHTSWVPTAFAGFMPSTIADGEESDIDPLQYRTELERLPALDEPLDEEGEDDVRYNREVFGQLTRAKEMLEQGELSD